ncbi:MORN repeat-containing protein 4 homolog [Aethina tumida]|uniref:MORN repeat-containing protein 4 homolog n=1 Tax=Aethina tumida TaxID=116153 RepID=UPI00096B024C|nr:MORN repeat-containing protein 4 homolog [Aethina tumida]
MSEEEETPSVEFGGFKYENGAIYVGSWNNQGQKCGEGHLLLPNGARYDGNFENNLFNGLGVLSFPDGAKYEGEFSNGWFHGHGTFWRADGMRYEGEYRGGKIWGLGLVTFNDDSHGFPRCEGYFENCKMLKRQKCPEVVLKAQMVSLMARKNSVENLE